MSDDWIKHDGGPCPVAPETRVDVRFDADEIDVHDPRPAGDWYWHKCGACTITHYRISEPKAPLPRWSSSAQAWVPVSPKAEPAKFQHISDAAWKAYDGSADARKYFDEYFKTHAVVLRTLAEWEALERRAAGWEADASQCAENGEYWRERAEKSEAALNDALAELRAYRMNDKPTIAPLPAPEPRNTSWPAPAHRPRWIPYT